MASYRSLLSTTSGVAVTLLFTGCMIHREDTGAGHEYQRGQTYVLQADLPVYKFQNPRMGSEKGLRVGVPKEDFAYEDDTSDIHVVGTLTRGSRITVKRFRRFALPDLDLTNVVAVVTDSEFGNREVVLNDVSRSVSHGAASQKKYGPNHKYLQPTVGAE